MPYRQPARRLGVAFALRGAMRLVAPLALLCCAAANAHAAPPSPREAQPYAAPVAEAAQRFGIPALWIWRVMHAESRGNSRAVSRAGAMGLMQIMPATWASLTARHRLGSDPYDVRANILAGAAYLRAMWDRYGDIELMLAAYNAGPGRADAFAARRRSLPAETIAYVAKIAPELVASRADLTPTPRMSALPDWRGAALFAPRLHGADALEASPHAMPTREPGDTAPAARALSTLFVPPSGDRE